MCAAALGDQLLPGTLKRVFSSPLQHHHARASSERLKSTRKRSKVRAFEKRNAERGRSGEERERIVVQIRDVGMKEETAEEEGRIHLRR